MTGPAAQATGLAFTVIDVVPEPSSKHTSYDLAGHGLTIGPG